MFWRILLIISVLPLLAALVLRWWFGLRVLAASGTRSCRCDPARWQQALGGDPQRIPIPEAAARAYGHELRLAALERWRAADPKSAIARESARRFGLAVPPLTAMVAVFAVVLAKVQVFGGIALFLGATAMAAVFGLLSLGAELQAIFRASQGLREGRVFVRRDDEEAVIAAAIAHAWCEAVPPVVRMIQPK